MKLSELVAYKTALDQYDFIRTSRGLIKKLMKVRLISIMLKA